MTEEQDHGAELAAVGNDTGSSESLPASIFVIDDEIVIRIGDRDKWASVHIYKDGEVIRSTANRSGPISVLTMSTFNAFMQALGHIQSLAGNQSSTEVSSAPAASPAHETDDSNSDGASLLRADPSAKVQTEPLPNYDGVIAMALDSARARLEEDGCDCGDLNDPPCALCLVEAAIAVRRGGVCLKCDGSGLAGPDPLAVEVDCGACGGTGYRDRGGESPDSSQPSGPSTGAIKDGGNEEGRKRSELVVRNASSLSTEALCKEGRDDL